MIRSLKKGDLIRYISKSKGSFTHNQIYEVVRGCKYGELIITIRDDNFKPHIITNEYFKDNFMIE